MADVRNPANAKSRRPLQSCFLSLAAAGALLPQGCATIPEDIAPAKVDDVSYAGWSCERLSQEQLRLDAALNGAADAQRKCRKTDTAGVLIIGLPVGSLLGCSVAAEIARLKREIELLQRQASSSDCALPPVQKQALKEDAAPAAEWALGAPPQTGRPP